MWRAHSVLFPLQYFCLYIAPIPLSSFILSLKKGHPARHSQSICVYSLSKLHFIFNKSGLALKPGLTKGEKTLNSLKL